MHNDLNQNYTKFSDFYVEDGSYLRLKSIQIGYSLPAPICTRLKLTKVRLYVSGQNLFTWTKWPGWDPETGIAIGMAGRPVLKSFTLGLDIVF